MANNIRMIDDLGQTLAQITELKKKVSAIEDALREAGPGTYEGRLFRATVGQGVVHCTDKTVTADTLKGSTGMTYNQATSIIWVPDMYELSEVAAAAETVLARRGAKFADQWQASYLLTSFRHTLRQQYVPISTSTGGR